MGAPRGGGQPGKGSASWQMECRQWQGLLWAPGHGWAISMGPDPVPPGGYRQGPGESGRGEREQRAAWVEARSADLESGGSGAAGRSRVRPVPGPGARRRAGSSSCFCDIVQPARLLGAGASLCGVHSWTWMGGGLRVAGQCPPPCPGQPPNTCLPLSPDTAAAVSQQQRVTGTRDLGISICVFQVRRRRQAGGSIHQPHLPRLNGHGHWGAGYDTQGRAASNLRHSP